MAAFITANPNPVLISPWRHGHDAVITWDTGSATSFGRVYLSIDGGNEEFFDGTPEPPSATPKRRSGTKKKGIQLGTTYDFRLKLATPQATVLATVQIKGEEKLGMTSGLKVVIDEMIPASQHIFGLRVYPGIGSVRIKFRTRQAALCFVEIKNLSTQETVVEFLPASNLVRDVLFASDGNTYTPNHLDHDSIYSFRIVATSLPGSKIPGEKTVTGQFRTGGRSAQVFFTRILVHNDGDPGFWLGDGDFDFYFGAGDVDTKEDLGNFEHYGRESIGSGQFRDVNRVVNIPRAPVRLWAQVYADEDDQDLDTFSAAGRVTTFRPPGSTCNGNFPSATVTEHFDFSDLTEGMEDRPFEMTNHSCPIHFTVSGHVRVEAHPGAILQPFIKKSGPKPRSPLPRVATLLHAGDKVIVGTGADQTQAVRLAPGGGAYVTTFSRKSTASSNQWARIDGEVTGPLTVVASGANHLSLFAVGLDGAVAYKTLSRDVSPSDTWETLGGAFVGPIAAAVGAEGRIEIFGLASDGRVLHRTLSGAGQGNRDWQLIGDAVGGSLTAFSSPLGVSVVALSHRGEVLHKLMRDEDWWPADRVWQSLGTAPAGPLCAELVEDDIVVLAVLAEDETVHLLPWRNYPDTPPRDDWQCVGTINSLLDARLSLIEPPPDADGDPQTGSRSNAE